MKYAISWALVLVMSVTAEAHFNMLLPQAAASRRGERVAIVYQWGHPFEHQLFVPPVPESFIVWAPDGKKMNLGGMGEEIRAADTNKVTGLRFHFRPEQRGDYILLLKCPPIWMEEDQEFLHDTVKVVLHVQAQVGWHADAGQIFEFVPLTRPYGLQPGMVFQARVLADGRPLPDALIEIERYNAVTPKELPADEQITRTARTDSNGVVTGSLTEAGWWCLTAQRDGGKREHNGKMYAVRQRTTFWVFVDERIPSR